MASKSKRSGFEGFTVALLAAAALILVWALVLFLQGGFQAAEAREFAAKNYQTPDPVVERYRAEQRAILEEKARWLDRDAGTVVMPVEDAMARIVEKNAGR